MSTRSKDVVGWHTNLFILSKISDETVDKVVSQQSIARETSVRGYKFFLESCIHDVLYKVSECMVRLSVPRLVASCKWNCNAEVLIIFINPQKRCPGIK